MSYRIAASSAAVSTVRSSRVGFHRMAPLLGSNRAPAFSSQVWVSFDAYARSVPPLAPCLCLSYGAFAFLAARKQTKFAMLSPLTSKPPLPSGIPSISASQRTV